MNAENALNVELVTAEGPRSVPSGINGLRIEAVADWTRNERASFSYLARPATSREMGPIRFRLFWPGHEYRIGWHDQAGSPAQRRYSRYGLWRFPYSCYGRPLRGRPAVTNHLGMALVQPEQFPSRLASWTTVIWLPVAV